MSIETFGLGAVINSDYRPRDYVNKHIAMQKARRDYFQESLKIADLAISKRIKMETETITDINRFNKKGQWAPEPNLRAHEPLKIGSAQGAMHQAGMMFDRFA